MSLSYNCLVDLGHQIENDGVFEAEKCLRDMLYWMRENDGPDAIYSSPDYDPVVYDVQHLINFWTEQQCESEPDGAALWRMCLRVLQANKVYLIWVSW